MEEESPHMYAGMRNVGVVAGLLSGADKHWDWFRERSEERLLAGHAEEDLRDTSKCR